MTLASAMVSVTIATAYNCGHIGTVVPVLTRSASAPYVTVVPCKTASPTRLNSIYPFALSAHVCIIRSQSSPAPDRASFILGSVPVLSAHASSGIGLESTILFASEGAHVVAADLDLSAAEKAVALVTSRYANAQAIAVKVDVGKEEEVEALVKSAVTKFGRLDIMVCSTLPSFAHRSLISGVQQCWCVVHVR